MADEPQVESTTTTNESDWKAKYEEMRQHSREWEKKARANQSAADELEKQRADSQTEQEKAIARAQKAEAELEKLKADAERAKTVSQVATDTGIPSEIVSMLNGKDADELQAQVEAIKKSLLQAPTRTDDGGGNTVAKKSNADRFAESLGL
jgi:chromosome segregation ATPase